MYGGNHREDFGKTPATFDRAGFEQWALDGGHTAGGDGWYAPYMFYAEMFRWYGGLDESLDPGYEFGGADIDLFERWKAAGNQVVRAPGSFVYHLQRWSDVEEQTADKRL